VPLSSGVASAAAPGVDAWRLSDTGGALMQLLRSIGCVWMGVSVHALVFSVYVWYVFVRVRVYVLECI